MPILARLPRMLCPVFAVTLANVPVGFARAQTVELDVVALEDTPAPGTDAAYGRFHAAPRMGPTGSVAFLALLAESATVDATNDAGLWLYEPGQEPVLIAREGSQAPGAPDGAVFQSVGNPISFDSGVVFRATLRHGSGGVDETNDSGLWRGAADLELVARRGSERVGAITEELAVNRSGAIAFVGEIGSPPFALDLAVWTVDESGVLDPVITTFEAAPGLPFVAIFHRFHSLALDDSGTLAFRGDLLHAGPVSDDDDAGIWIRPAGGDVALLVREGDPAPDVAGGPLLDGLAVPTLAGDGILTFAGSLDPDSTGIDDTNRDALWRSDSGGVPEVAFRSGEPVAGFPGGFTGRYIQWLKRNSEGAFAFLGRIRVSEDEEDDRVATFGPDGTGDLVPRLVEGEPLADIGPGIELGSFLSFDLADGTMLAQLGYLQGPGVTSFDNVVVLWSEAESAPVRVFRSGDDVTVAPGDVRAGYYPYFDDGAAMSDAGDLVMSVDFADARAFVRARVVPAPEPSAAILLATGAAVLRLASRRRR